MEKVVSSEGEGAWLRQARRETRPTAGDSAGFDNREAVTADGAGGGGRLVGVGTRRRRGRAGRGGARER